MVQNINGSQSKHTLIYAQAMLDSSSRDNGITGESPSGASFWNNDQLDVQVVSFKRIPFINHFSMKTGTFVASRVVKTVLDLRNKQGDNFNPKKISLAGTSRGAYAVYKAAAILKEKHGILVHTVIQITPVFNGGDGYINSQRGGNNLIKEKISSIDELDSIKPQKSILGIKNTLIKKAINCVTRGGYQLEEKDRKILKDCSGSLTKIPVHQVVGLRDDTISTYGLKYNSQFADTITYYPENKHCFYPTWKNILDIVNAPETSLNREVIPTNE